MAEDFAFQFTREVEQRGNSLVTIEIPFFKQIGDLNTFILLDEYRLGGGGPEGLERMRRKADLLAGQDFATAIFLACVPGPKGLPGMGKAAGGGAKSAYEIAAAGGKHAGTLRNYAGRSAAQIQKAITSYERQIALHQQKIANPAQFAERWGQMGAQEQAGLVNKWGADAARNQELADVLRGLLESR
jgi:hypothetical protein